MNAVLLGNRNDPSHIGLSLPGKLLRATRKKNLESRRDCLHKHPAGHLAGIFEDVDRFFGHEDDGSRRDLVPFFVAEEGHPAFLHKEEFVFILVRVRRRTALWRSDFRPQRDPAAGLRAIKMDGNFLSESMQFVTLAGGENTGEQAAGHSVVLANSAWFGKTASEGRRESRLLKTR
jgi:hypothetical protein